MVLPSLLVVVACIPDRGVRQHRFLPFTIAGVLTIDHSLQVDRFRDILRLAP